MKSLISAAALFILLTPVVAQQADQPANDPAQSSAPQGMTQAQALAQAAAQEQTAAPAETPQPVVPSQPEATPQPTAAQPDQATPQAPPPADAAPAAPTETAQQPYPDNQPRSERRPLEVTPAVRPRAEAAAYPVYRQQAALSIGARLLSQDEVDKKFATPISKKYLVVEVGVFSTDAKPVELRLQSFALRPGSDDQAFFPAVPEDIAGALAPNRGGRPRNVAFFPGVGVGYGRGPWGSNVGVGVGAGTAGPRSYPRGAADATYRTMLQELRDKSLPLGTLTQPVAGYLYFPLNGKRAKHYNLELNQTGEALSLALPDPKK
jgi:hypothetical protein